MAWAIGSSIVLEDPTVYILKGLKTEDLDRRYSGEAAPLSYEGLEPFMLALRNMSDAKLDAISDASDIAVSNADARLSLAIACVFNRELSYANAMYREVNQVLSAYVTVDGRIYRITVNQPLGSSYKKPLENKVLRQRNVFFSNDTERYSGYTPYFGLTDEFEFVASKHAQRRLALRKIDSAYGSNVVTKTVTHRAPPVEVVSTTPQGSFRELKYTIGPEPLDYVLLPGKLVSFSSECVPSVGVDDSMPNVDAAKFAVTFDGSGAVASARVSSAWSRDETFTRVGYEALYKTLQDGVLRYYRHPWTGLIDGTFVGGQPATPCFDPSDNVLKSTSASAITAIQVYRHIVRSHGAGQTIADVVTRIAVTVLRRMRNFLGRYFPSVTHGDILTRFNSVPVTAYTQKASPDLADDFYVFAGMIFRCCFDITTHSQIQSFGAIDRFVLYEAIVPRYRRKLIIFNVGCSAIVRLFKPLYGKDKIGSTPIDAFMRAMCYDDIKHRPYLIFSGDRYIISADSNNVGDVLISAKSHSYGVGFFKHSNKYGIFGCLINNYLFLYLRGGSEWHVYGSPAHRSSLCTEEEEGGVIVRVVDAALDSGDIKGHLAL